MKKKNLKICLTLIIMLAIVLIQTIVFAAETLTLKVLTDKDSYEVDETVTVTVDWTEEAEAVGATLKYDEEKLTFTSTTLGENFYNAETAGEILFNWASFDGSKLTKVTFVFTVKAAGDTNITVENAVGFSVNGSLTEPEYEYESKTISIIAETLPGEEPDDNTPEEDDTIIYQYVSFPYVVFGGEFDIDVTSLYDGEYTMYYQFVEIPSEVIDELIELNEKYDNDEITYDEYYTQYNNAIPQYNNNWTETEDGIFTYDLSEFEGEKYFAVWVKLEMPDKTVYEYEIYGLDGTGNGANNPGEIENIEKPGKDETKAEGSMPYTGAENVIYVIALIAVVGIIGFIRYRKLSDI